MDIDKLREELKRDEGCVHSVYLDHLNLKTVGIGHLLTEWDEEYDKPVGTEVLYDDFDDLPEEAKRIIANMMFNLGRPRLSKFIRMRENVNKRDWKSAAAEMRSSRWYDQVTKRAERLCERMEAIST